MPPRILLFSLLFAQVAAHAANLTLDETSINFGEQFQFTVATHDLRVWNRSDAPIQLVEPKPTRSGIVLSFDKTTIAPGESTVVHVRWPLENNVGSLAVRLRLDTIESGKPASYAFMFRGFVNSVLSDPHPTADLGVVDTLHDPPSRTVPMTSDLDPSLHVTKILDVPDYLSARIADDGKSVVIQPKGFTVLGLREGQVKVALDSKLQAEAAIRVQMDLHGNVVPDQNPLDFGLQRPKMARTARLQLTSRDGAAFRVGKVTPSADSRLSIESTPCLPKTRKDCKAFTLTVDKDRPLGPISGSVAFELPDTSQQLNVAIGGMFVSDDTVVQTLDNAASKQPAAVDLSKALKKAVQPPPAPVEAPPGKGPLLKWSVANEAGVYGYAVFRSDSKDGRYERINDTIIAAKNGGNESSASYQWRDTSAQAGKEYWYFVSMYYGSGKRVQLTGPQKVVARPDSGN